MTRSYALRFLSPLISRVEGWRAGVARGPPTHTTSPAPSTSHATCGFPALRAPICFTPKLMGPILRVVQPPPIPSFPAEALSFLSMRQMAPDLLLHPVFDEAAAE